jgi:outer membrane protein assembly factor BamB
MKKKSHALTSMLATWVLIGATHWGTPVVADDWSQFRGGTALSIASNASLPTTWDQAPKPAWRTPIEGSGWSQPIVVGDKIFVTTAVSPRAADKPKGMMGGVIDPSTMGKAPKPKDPLQWKLMCLALDSGELQWQQTVTESIPAFGKHASNTFATETPAASNDTVYVFFGAAGVLAAYDFQGQQKWTKSFEPQKISNDFGTGSSVVLSNDALFVQLYNDQSAILYCLNATDGSLKWQSERDKGSAWSTPIVWNNQGVQEIVTAGSGSVIALDIATGTERWRYGNLDTSFSCSIVADEESVYFGTASPGSRAPIAAIASGHSGDLSLAKGETSSDAIRWSGFKSGAGMPSPVIVGDYLYFFGNTATCYDKRTGKELYRKRMPGGTLVAGCPVVVGNKIYLVNESGNLITLTASAEFDPVELATGAKDEVYWATPAVAGNSLLVRSSDAIYCYR